MMPMALEGIKVIDVSQVAAVPCAPVTWLISERMSFI